MKEYSTTAIERQGADMAQRESQSGDDLKAIDRKRSWIVGTAVLALVVLAVALFRAPPGAFVAVAVIILISLKKAAVRYRALGKRKADLLDGLSSANTPQG